MERYSHQFYFIQPKAVFDISKCGARQLEFLKYMMMERAALECRYAKELRQWSVKNEIKLSEEQVFGSGQMHSIVHELLTEARECACGHEDLHNHLVRKGGPLDKIKSFLPVSNFINTRRKRAATITDLDRMVEPYKKLIDDHTTLLRKIEDTKKEYMNQKVKIFMMQRKLERQMAISAEKGRPIQGTERLRNQLIHKESSLNLIRTVYVQSIKNEEKERLDFEKKLEEFKLDIRQKERQRINVILDLLDQYVEAIDFCPRVNLDQNISQLRWTLKDLDWKQIEEHWEKSNYENLIVPPKDVDDEFGTDMENVLDNLKNNRSKSSTEQTHDQVVKAVTQALQDRADGIGTDNSAWHTQRKTEFKETKQKECGDGKTEENDDFLEQKERGGHQLRSSKGRRHAWTEEWHQHSGAALSKTFVEPTASMENSPLISQNETVDEKNKHSLNQRNNGESDKNGVQRDSDADTGNSIPNSTLFRSWKVPKYQQLPGLDDRDVEEEIINNELRKNVVCKASNLISQNWVKEKLDESQGRVLSDDIVINSKEHNKPSAMEKTEKKEEDTLYKLAVSRFAEKIRKKKKVPTATLR